MPERERGQEFTRGTGADRRVMLQRNDFLQEFLIGRGKPRKTEPWQTVGFANRAETQGTVIKVTSRGKASGGVVLKFAVYFVGEDIDVVLRRKFKDRTENFQRHQEPR